MNDARSGSAARAARGLDLGVAALLLALYFLQVARFDFLCDDAYISFRYALNLAQGHGLRFNLAESPPVEGFSNFLWVVVLGAGEALGIASGVSSRVVSVACGALLVLRLLRFLRRRLELGPVAAGLVGLTFVLLPPVGVWSTSGLAILPFALLFFLAFELWIAREEPPPAWSGGLVLLGLALLRTEGVLWAGLLLAIAGGLGFRRAGDAWPRRAAPALAILVLGFGAFLLGRHAYFGDWVSNTARAKGEMTAFTLQRGSAYVGSFLLDHAGAALVLVAALVLFARRRDARLGTGLAVVGASAGFSIAVGGDFMPFYRFFVIAAPFLTLLLGLVVRAAGERGAAWRRTAPVLALPVTVLSFLPQLDRSVAPAAWREACRFRWNFFLVQEELVPLGELGAWERSKANADLWARMGKALALVTEPGDSLVLGPIGAVGYHSQLHLYDQGGLIDRDVQLRPTAAVKRSPGHDRAVPIRWFADQAPTFAFARLTRRRPGLEAAARRAFALYLERPEEGDLAERYRVEIVDLPAGVGFDPDEVLILGRRIPG